MHLQSCSLSWPRPFFLRISKFHLSLQSAPCVRCAKQLGLQVGAVTAPSLRSSRAAPSLLRTMRRAARQLAQLANACSQQLPKQAPCPTTSAARGGVEVGAAAASFHMPWHGFTSSPGSSGEPVLRFCLQQHMYNMINTLHAAGVVFHLGTLCCSMELRAVRCCDQCTATSPQHHGSGVGLRRDPHSDTFYMYYTRQPSDEAAQQSNVWSSAL